MGYNIKQETIGLCEYRNIYVYILALWFESSKKPACYGGGGGGEFP